LSELRLPAGADLIRLEETLAAFRRHGLAAWAEQLPGQLAEALDERAHGSLGGWLEVIMALPDPGEVTVALDASRVAAECAALDPDGRERIRELLDALHPWRKGPYELCGIHIDTEWRSDWKWERVAPHLAPLAGRRVLDVGCGNGYHLWRMAGAGAALAVGIDPTQLFLAQFLAVRHFLGAGGPVHLLPLGIEQVPAGLGAFDTVFSMGVLYHRRSPIDHLLELRDALRPGGELVLETLVIEGGAGEVLVPEGRYAKMRNVWFIPSVPELERWLRRAGLRDVRTVDVTVTTVDEQRPTAWMRFESLPDFLDPDDPTRTVEGLPAPRRAVVVAQG
jgi:tRNA (mo5U34)-methyltransferase